MAGKCQQTSFYGFAELKKYNTRHSSVLLFRTCPPPCLFWYLTVIDLKILNLNIVLVALLRLVRGPEGQVVSEQLHDESRVLVALLRKGI